MAKTRLYVFASKEVKEDEEVVKPAVVKKGKKPESPGNSGNETPGNSGNAGGNPPGNNPNAGGPPA